MSPDQKAAIETVRNSLDWPINTLSNPSVETFDRVPAALENLRKAQELLNDILLEYGRPSDKKEVVDRLVQDLAREHSERFEG